VQWEDGIRAHATSKAITDDQIATAANTPEGNAFVQNMLAPRIKAEIEKVMAGQLNGTRSVRLDVTVKTFALASAVQRILIGGGRGMIADANLVDARTGAVIIANHDLRAVLFAGEGIVGTAVQAAIDSSSTQNVVEKLVDRYGESYRDWLLRRT
jgi:lysozyme family protein